jgi:N-succinyldiaminopimelate aminotransferase
MNPRLAELQPYPFEKLAKLKAGVSPPADKPHIALSIGEPKHETPAFIQKALCSAIGGLSSYPMTVGSIELRSAIAGWLSRRFHLKEGIIDPEKHVLPVNGTREALFAIAQAVVDSGDAWRRPPQSDKSALSQPFVMMPNPFYQIYEGAALLAGAKPYFMPDFTSIPKTDWDRCQLLYVCTPGNPTGAVLDEQTLRNLIELSDRYGFIIASDECYSEIYFDEEAPPLGLLEVCSNMGRDDFKNCIVFHSLSKRSNVPGMRSGFVAGDADVLKRFLQYRTYHGCAMSPPIQVASTAAWSDEDHVKQNRELYRKKFDAVLRILSPIMEVQKPDAAFYLWPKTPMPDEEFARELFRRQNVTVLPGSYLSREWNGLNPGANHVRMALVASLDECVEAARRIAEFLK